MGGEGRLRLTLVVAEAEEADDVGVAEAEEDVELQAEGAVEALAGAKDLEGGEGVGRGGEGGEVDGAEAALANDRGGCELTGQGFDLGPPEPAGGGFALNRVELRFRFGVGAVGDASTGVVAQLHVVGVTAAPAARYRVPAQDGNVGKGEEGEGQDERRRGETDN